MGRRKWTPDDIQKAASLYEYRSDFQEKQSSAYAAARRLGILDEVCAHMPKRKPREIKWTKESLSQEAKKYTSRWDFAKYSRSAYNTACSKGILDDICGHMDSVRRPMGYWTKERILKEAQGYPTKRALLAASPEVYNAAWRKKLLGEIFPAEIKNNKKPWGYWTKERILKEAKKYRSRSEFFYSNPGVYSKARIKGILDDVCEHMKQYSDATSSATKKL